MQEMTIDIGGRKIGRGHPVFIIAEVGVNHNGNVGLAKRLIREAKTVGADSVKFQTFKASQVITRDAPKANYQLQTTNPKETQYNMLRKLELDRGAYQELVALCKESGILFLSTPYNREDADFLEAMGVPAFKLASIHIAEPSFLQYIARFGKPMIVSTGMATLAEVDEAVRVIRNTGNQELVLLQCTTNYPAHPQDANLRAMQTMREAFGTLIGYSDHTQSNVPCIAAVAMGATVIEKHFTLDKSLPGPDQSSSADPAEFKQLVAYIREAEFVMGSGIKEPSEIERINSFGMRRSIVAKHKIAAGQVITEDMLTFKRPASGLRPSLFFDVLGRVAKEDIEADQILLWEMCGDKSGH